MGLERLLIVFPETLQFPPHQASQWDTGVFLGDGLKYHALSKYTMNRVNFESLLGGLCWIFVANLNIVEQAFKICLCFEINF